MVAYDRFKRKITFESTIGFMEKDPNNLNRCKILKGQPVYIFGDDDYSIPIIALKGDVKKTAGFGIIKFEDELPDSDEHDTFGVPIRATDLVAFSRKIFNGAALQGTIVKFTKKQIKIKLCTEKNRLETTYQPDRAETMSGHVYAPKDNVILVQPGKLTKIKMLEL